MLDQDIKVSRQVEDARWLDGQRREAIIRVEFKVGDHGPFVERFPKEGYTASVRDERLNTFAREVRTR